MFYGLFVIGYKIDRCMQISRYHTQSLQSIIGQVSDVWLLLLNEVISY